MGRQRPGQLAPREEAFCVNYFLTKNGAESIRRAGYSPNDAAGYAKVKLKKPSILARLAQLNSAAIPNSDDAVAVVQERWRLLTKVARHEIEAPVTAGHVVGAIDLMNKMGGDYAPEKHEGVVITLTGDDLARIYREARGQFLQAGGKPLGLVDGGGDGERPAAGGGADEVPAVAPPAQGASGDREKR